MPMELVYMSVSPDPIVHSSLLVIGGYANIQTSSILRLTCLLGEDCEWETLPIHLEVPRERHVSFFTKKPLNCSINP